MHRAAALLALLLPSAALAAPATGFPALPDCSNTTDEIDSQNAELYVLKLTATASQRSNDWLWNVERKTEANSDAQAMLDNGGFWSTGDVWAVSQSGTDAAFAFITFANGDLYVDGNDGASVDWGVAPVQHLGDSLAVGRDAGIGLLLPRLPGSYSVQLAPGITRSFPIITTSSALEFAFAPIAEVNPRDAVPGICQIGGNSFQPLDPTRGAIIGYNVYRLPPCGCHPTPQDVMNAALTDDDSDGGWIHFIDLRTFDVTIADSRPGFPGSNAPNDLVPNDPVGLQNPDGRMYSGDEVLLFSDDANVHRIPGSGGPPMASVNYWYALQPVVQGKVSDFANVGFTVNDMVHGDHRMDLDHDGEYDAVSLNTVAPNHDTCEFYSPQAEPGNGAQDGLGLTNHGIGLFTGCFQFDWSVPLPATSSPTLSGEAHGALVDLLLATGLETSSVLGYAVWRVAGAQRVRVNEEPILAIGGESAVYALQDRVPPARGSRDLRYEVETLGADGSVVATTGPFTVEPGVGRRAR